ncbi:MAG TPA: hypothetical protein VNS19_16930 [Acidimicrobiales bacterium]|nr:hypothetical protein [Acidimicrobiales bacterium]
MNTDKILIYGERLGDLKEAYACLPGAARKPLTAELVNTVAPFLRAIRRARAEVLLHQADRGGLGFLDMTEAEQEAEAAGRVLLEMLQVETDPFFLRSHPALAGIARR